MLTIHRSAKTVRDGSSAQGCGPTPDTDYMASEEFDGMTYADRCFACDRRTEPREMFGPTTANGHTAARAFYTCDESHPADVPHADWWVDWYDGERHERIRIFDPSTGDKNAGSTWSGVPLPI
jgi:hypothetical protein